MWPIIVTTSLELLHVDITGFESTMELDESPNVVNLLVFCDHFTKHVMAYVTPDQTVKTVLIFRALARVLSDQGGQLQKQHHQRAL